MVEAKKDVKTTVKPAEEAVKPTAAKAEAKQAAPVEEVKTEAVAAAETEAAPAKKAPARKAAAKKAPAKTTAAKKEPVKKDTVKKEVKAPAKKTAAKKAEPKAEVHFQFDGKDLVAKDVLDRAVKAYKSNHKGVEIKTIELYIVANEGTAYYVVNGEANDDFKVVL